MRVTVIPIIIGTLGWVPQSLGKRAGVVFWPSTRPKMPFQGDAPEGGDIF